MFNNLSLTEIGVVFISILVSMAIHEATHAYVSHWLGDTTAQDMGRLTLNPFKHIDIFTTVLLPILLIFLHLPPFFAAKPVPFNPERVKYGEYGAAMVGVAGPLTNLLLAICAALALHVFGNGSIANYLLIFMQVNISFFVFNMIPFPPLDGSRLLYAIAPEWLQRIMYQIESFGFMSILIFMLLIFQFISPVIYSVSVGLMNLLLG